MKPNLNIQGADGMNPNPNILFEVKSLSNLIRRQIDNALSKRGENNLTEMQGFVIGYLSEHNDIDVFQRDLEIAFRIRRSTATGILQIMEKSALIERKPVLYDARLKKLMLTQKAIGLHENFLHEMGNLEANVQRGVTKTEREIFLTILNKIKANIE